MGRRYRHMPSYESRNRGGFVEKCALKRAERRCGIVHRNRRLARRAADPDCLRAAVGGKAHRQIGDVSAHERSRRHRLRHQHRLSRRHAVGGVERDLVRDRYGRSRAHSRWKEQQPMKSMWLATVVAWMAISPLSAAPLQDGPYVMAGSKGAWTSR